MTTTKWKRTAAAVFGLALALAGCSGKDGTAGPAGTNGTDGTNGSSVGSISVTVYDAAGAALSDATVTTIPATSSATTAADGKATLSNVPIGSWLVTANKSGLKADGASVTVVANGTSTATLHLQAAPQFALARVVGIPAGYTDALPAGEVRFTQGSAGAYTYATDIKTIGLPNVPVKQYVYLQAAKEDAGGKAITSQSWKITTYPSAAAPALQYWDGTTKPRVWDTTSTGAANVRFRPLVPGTYTVTVTATSSAGTSTYDLEVYAGTYVGAAWCASCHSNAEVVGEGKDVYSMWSLTGHATKFQTTYGSYTAGGSCVQCHTTGYDESTVGGFDDKARESGWNPATNSFLEWAKTQWPTIGDFIADSRTAPMQELMNIQCESCHGPGSNHPPAASHMSWDPAVCAQCHTQPAQWALSKHATPTPSHMASASCMPCHSGQGFVVSKIQDKPIVFPDQAFPGHPATVFEKGMTQGIGCVTCHDPHLGTGKKSAQLRLESASFTAPMGFAVTAAESAACKKCHIDKRDTTYYQQFLTGGQTRGPHQTQTDMLAGKGGAEFSGNQYGSSSHTTQVGECARCHMFSWSGGPCCTAASCSPVAACGTYGGKAMTCSSTTGKGTCNISCTQNSDCPDPGMTCDSHGRCADTSWGGHTFSMTYTDGTNTTHPHMSACRECHSEAVLPTFDRVLTDWAAGTGTRGIQGQIGSAADNADASSTSLLARLGRKLSVALGQAETAAVPDAVPAGATLTTAQRQAYWNFWYVANDGSRGIHNTKYAVQLLCDSLKALDPADPCTRP